ncbi:disease resistance protein At4g27190-like isoform X3 [Primulina eburnea]|uniref:disease resistance protein At4g27190-like isoform X3 n=1 Tax=Primulina eburnea TaxID=1245227 RepID=UPI003C6C47D3
MAALLMILEGVVAKLGEYLVPPIKRQFNYMCCYGNNIKDLQCEVDKLLRTEGGVQLQVDEARGNLERIGPDVENWLREVENIKNERHNLHADAANVSEVCIHGGLTGMKSRYQLSKRSKKIVKKAIQLQQEGKFGRVSYPVPLGEMLFFDPPVVLATENTEVAETECPPIESDNRFITRKFVEETIIATLQDRGVKIVGLCGMGGVGKTTMVRRIGKLVKEKKMFDVIVMAVVTQHPDQKRIQNQIAEMLNFKLEAEHESNRGILLRKRILGIKRILVILDDIWGRLDLNELGIPLELSHINCKILLTSRARDVCVQMGAGETFELQVLSREEAWILFSEEAGISDSDCTNLYAIAKDVANECKGLPVAIASVARALKQKSNRTWENALVQLRNSTPTNILGVLNDVYRPLELSYLALEGNDAKDLFLLCSLFREDSNICIENLVRYGIGLDIFKGINNIREGRIRTHALIEVLKDRFLLQDGHKEGFVKMHDVVRDVAISIAAKDEPRFLIDSGSTGVWSQRSLYQHYTCISLFSNFANIPDEIIFPNVVFLLWESMNQIGRIYKIEMFGKLNVLDLRCTDIPAVPSSIQKLPNLRALHLCGCGLENLSIVGELINLEILCIQSTELKIFPAALGKLANLRLLDLTDCENLQEIEQGAIGGLLKLEELYVTKNFAAWGAGVFELGKLPNLTTLRILVANGKITAENINCSSELKYYDISISAISERLITCYPSIADIPHEYKRSFDKVMDFYLPTATYQGEWISSLLKRTEDLRLNGDGSNNIVNALGLKGFQHLKQLGIQDCKTVEHLVSTMNGNTQSFGVFPILETLYLCQVSSMNEICIGQLPERSFGELRYLHLQELINLKNFYSGPSPKFRLSNLRSMYIYQCRNLKSLFSNSVAQSLLQLEELDIGDCQKMDKVFFHENGHDRTSTYNMEFPKLEKLVLRCLHNLSNFSTGIAKILFPRLRVLKMEDLPRFKGFCTANRNFISRTGDDMNSQILFSEMVDCPRIKTLSLRRIGGVSKVFCHQLPSCFLQELEFLEVDACSGLKAIFSHSMTQGPVKLKELRIRNCRELTKVVENQNEAQQNANTSPLSSSNTTCIFHQLEYLKVDMCDRLGTLFTPSIARDLVKLKELRLTNCKELEEVIEKEENQLQVNKNSNPFPQLSPIMEYLAKIAKNAKQMIAYGKTCKQGVGEQASQICSPVNASNETSESRETRYASCESHICNHEEEPPKLLLPPDCSYEEEPPSFDSDFDSDFEIGIERDEIFDKEEEAAERRRTTWWQHLKTKYLRKKKKLKRGEEKQAAAS